MSDLNDCLADIARTQDHDDSTWNEQEQIERLRIEEKASRAEQKQFEEDTAAWERRTQAQIWKNAKRPF